MNDNAAAIESGKIWLEFALKMLILTVVLGSWPVLVIYFRRRRERRLALGWKLIPNPSRVMKDIDRLASMFGAFFVGAMVVSWLHIDPWHFFLLSVVLQMITIREKWVAPGSATETEQGHGVR